ncbi:sigma-54-dependent transcriptional regulator [Pseudoxanthomonas composti]|uniref:Sigma-54-dependent Fis family transcriptional regulator n=1 Tax=Pseudoxanthomonas composti TaxID=2137479 RepID=A0A4Q1JYW4_9GAMM|nr:sigma-54 dependent transcriptional regulator [Pseudoxanthomonas composti]RXR07242.1 sigma-54-dependent Fis family transcriptional regulator [Pseudoxanthomonas composti]
MTVTRPPQRVLVVDDQDDVRQALRLLLKTAGYGMVGAAAPDEALALLRGDDFAAVLVDMNYSRDTTSGAEGLELIAQIATQWPGLPVVAMTAWASVELAVQAMRVGAVDFIEKPWNNARVLSVLESRIALDRSQRERQRLSAANALLASEGSEGFIAASPVMQRLMEDLLRVAHSDATVLLLGENGTGKSMIGQLIHQWSPRREQALVKVNLGGLAPTLFEAELFGNVKGAYTDARQERVGRFELADGGTLFLDEIGNLPLEQQPKLLRAIEDGEFERLGSSRTLRVDTRIVAATNADLAAEVAAGRFRQDLLYRINTFQVRVPPLRERREDIPPLARHYLAAACQRYGRAVPGLAPSAERALLGYAWPGNVRELSHAMERAALLSTGARLGAEDLRLQPAPSLEASLAGMTLEQAEAWLLRKALREHPGNLQRSADQLGITRQSLYRRMEKHGLGEAASES